MLTMDELMAMLSGVGADFQFIEQDSPILFTSDAKKIFQYYKPTPTFILENENGLMACIVSSRHGRLDRENMKKRFGYLSL